MTKYLIFALIFIVLILLAIVLFPLMTNQGKNNPSPTPLPTLTAPSAPPTIPAPILLPSEPPSGSSSANQIKIQSQADRDFAEKTQTINTTYPWLNKLPIQTSNYYVYFDVKQKQFIAKLYPSPTLNTPIDQQVINFKNEITVKLQGLIPNYSQYNIKWDIISE